MNDSLTYITWNVKGLGHIIKRKKILTFLKREGASVVMIQETHLSDLEHLKRKRDWVGQVFFASCNSNPRKRGVAILINKHLPFVCEKQINDPEGRYILISGLLYGQHITMLNIYAPNVDCTKFMSDIIQLFNNNRKNLGIMAGDFNCIKIWRDPLFSQTILNLHWCLMRLVKNVLWLIFGGN